ncbi:BUD13 homolog [Mytilus edulis]
MAEISKAEYLKRYLSGPEENEKKKKRRKVVKSNSKHIRSTIIDDDVDLKSLLPENLENTLDEDIGEDDPTIVAIIDERPDTIQQLETYRHSDGRWKTLGKDDDFDPSLLKSMKDEDILKNTKSFFKNKRESEYNKKSVSRQSDLPRRKRHDSDSDNSLPRKHRHDSDSDQSLPRNQRHDSDSDQSLPRKQRHDSDSDSSPARKPKSLIRKSRFEPRKRLDSDESPPRRQRHDSGSDKSPPRRKRHESGSDQSPPRRIRKDSGSDQSPPRRKRNNSDSDQSPPRKKDKMSKTLSGKKAGLQSAKDMKMEAEKMKKKEDDAFKKISNDALGRDAVTVFRDRKTGKRRNMEDEAEKNAEQLEKERQMKEKYEKWGKGMKQQEQQQRNVEEHLHEASKPMARFKDDDDLDKHLKEITRADDPMLKFLKKKKPKDSKKKELPKYKGAPPPPNRFNMMPGYRWDGVDRSNGFEAKYFASISNKKAITEDAYKWSVEDM